MRAKSDTAREVNARQVLVTSLALTFPCNIIFHPHKKQIHIDFWLKGMLGSTSFS